MIELIYYNDLLASFDLCLKKQWNNLLFKLFTVANVFNSLIAFIHSAVINASGCIWIAGIAMESISRWKIFIAAGSVNSRTYFRINMVCAGGSIAFNSFQFLGAIHRNIPTPELMKNKKNKSRCWSNLRHPKHPEHEMFSTKAVRNKCIDFEKKNILFISFEADERTPMLMFIIKMTFRSIKFIYC